MATPGIAASAYAQVARITDPTSLGGSVGDAGAGKASQGFGAMLKDAIASVAEAGRKSDAQSQAVAAGKANVIDVATAVAESEVAIDALVSVRDKVIQAYEEIMKMPI